MGHRASKMMSIRPLVGLSAGLIFALACGQQESGSAAPEAAATHESASDAMHEAEDASADVAASTQVETSGFVYKELAIATDSAEPGEGKALTLQGNQVVLKGTPIRVGDTLPEATLVASGMEQVSIVDGKGHVRILSIVPALETPVCEQQTHYLSEKNDGLEEQIELVTVSLDPPELQAKFAEEAEIENVTFLSDAPAAAFGNASGLLIEKPRILARAVLVVDSDNVVRYMQVVPEITKMPDMDAAFAFARGLVAESAPSES